MLNRHTYAACRPPHHTACIAALQAHQAVGVCLRCVALHAMVLPFMRRSEAWEEWAEWELEQQQQQPPDAQSGGGTASAWNSSTLHGPVAHLLRSCFRQWCSSTCAAGRADTAAGPSSGGCDAAGAGSSSQQGSGGTQEGGARHALVFCYANDLKWYHTM